MAFILAHGESRILLVDREFSAMARVAVSSLARPPRIIDILDSEAPEGPSIGETDYEALLASGDPDFCGVWPADEWQPIALNYTSGTTGDPKGVVPSHRGTYLMSLTQMTDWALPRAPTYLWTLPMFHANGWCFTWAITASAGTHVCLRKVAFIELPKTATARFKNLSCVSLLAVRSLLQVSRAKSNGLSRLVERGFGLTARER